VFVIVIRIRRSRRRVLIIKKSAGQQAQAVKKTPYSRLNPPRRRIYHNIRMPNWLLIHCLSPFVVVFVSINTDFTLV